MPIQTAELYVKDRASRPNKDLLDYLHRNLRPIILRGQIKFKFNILTKEDKSRMLEKGLKKFPAMILNNQKIIGVSEIITVLRKQVQQSNSMVKPKSEEEVLSEYYENAFNDVKFDSEGKHVLPEEGEDVDDFKNSLQQRLQEELQRREEATGKKNQRGYTHREIPSGPDRSAIRSNLDDQPRNNNTNDYTDPMTIANNISSGSRDDELFKNMLTNMSDDVFVP